ncbi:hypothetical protein BC830DRAFT_1225628 [Chytriomyces sp. MP71]|nr:hypothetical protein BC830DRAFT_1225628 [Chytriomyces sp. MP71]
MSANRASESLATIICALLGSSCCAIQLMLNAMSLGCAGFSALDPFAPVFASLSFTFLFAAFVRNGLKANRRISVTAFASLLLLLLPQLVRLHSRNKLWPSRVPTLGFEKLAPACISSFEWTIHGLKCLGCAARLKSHLEGVQGIASADVDFTQSAVTVHVPGEETVESWESLVLDAVGSLDFTYSMEFMRQTLNCK